SIRKQYSEIRRRGSKFLEFQVKAQGVLIGDIADTAARGHMCIAQGGNREFFEVHVIGSACNIDVESYSSRVGQVKRPECRCYQVDIAHADKRFGCRNGKFELVELFGDISE